MFFKNIMIKNTLNLIQIYNNYEEDGYTTEDSYDSDYWDDPDYDD